MSSWYYSKIIQYCRWYSFCRSTWLDHRINILLPAQCIVPCMESNKLLLSTIETIVMKNNISGVGSNRVLQGPPIQVVGVALITDHNYSFIEVIFQ